MFQSVFALGIVLATIFYAIISMIRFILPSKNKSVQGGCAEGKCNCNGNKHKNRLKGSVVKTVKLH